MHPAIAATIGVVVFLLLGSGISLLVSGSLLDPMTALLASVVIFVIVYRRLSRRGT